MKDKQPHIVILAGPNGAGKSTIAPVLLRDTFAVAEFVNADAIAQGLSAFAPERVALEAGKIMLRRLRELTDRRSDFAFETTLASRSFAPWLAGLRESGYRVHLMFLTLPDADFAVNRVATRIMLGGHAIDETVIRRRFSAGLKNLFRLYLPVVSSWKIFDNSTSGKPVDIAESDGYTISVADAERFEKLKADCANG
ncbi:MAG: zeta toxin family protein [Planctomycetota bacterium]|jgi:predicted ABC-type ATPase|nr:zeta toxin family protein [Planctomycetota bacterium]